MYGYGFYMDEPWVIALLIIGMIFSMYTQFSVSRTFKKYSNKTNSRGITGADAAKQVLQQNGVYGVRIERVSGNLTDHFDPSSNVIRLSTNVHDSTSPAAIGVAAHEAGHAVQYDSSYAPIKMRTAFIPITNIGTNASMPLILLGILVSAPILTNIGILLFSTIAVFQLITLPVEFNASARAMTALSDGNILQDDELKSARKVLTAAALTYVAALALSIINIIRLISRYGNRE